MDKDELKSNLRKKIIECLNLGDIGEEDLTYSTPLFGEDGLGLDSVDALELIVMLERDYSISVNDGADTKTAFATIDSLADYVLSNGK
ncbi:MAG: acyl carrier protein [Verrucomicrobia bacterium]|nr:MAG: acyl carrier protein [Verrucomicrobiota bacterium]